jgi:uncharacterized protein (DUF1810 family)
MDDPHDLRRFVVAQEGHYQRALLEVRAGEKRSHWMWFVFPQFDGLGHSPMSQRYSIKSIAEAKAYLHHPILGPRLVECCEAVLGVKGRSANEIFGFPDDGKLRSCATLFAEVSSPESVFERVLHIYYEGVPDPVTLHAVSSRKQHI